MFLLNTGLMLSAEEVFEISLFNNLSSNRVREVGTPGMISHPGTQKQREVIDLEPD